MIEVRRYDLVGDMDGNCNINEARMELSNDGVYVKHRDYEALQAKCAAMAVDNAKLKKFCKDAAFDADYEAELGMERGGFSDALNEIKTPATDAFLAEVRAQGVEMYADSLDNGADDAERGGFDYAVKFLRSEASGVRLFANQLHKGGNQ